MALSGRALSRALGTASPSDLVEDNTSVPRDESRRSPDPTPSAAEVMDGGAMERAVQTTASSSNAESGADQPLPDAPMPDAPLSNAPLTDAGTNVLGPALAAQAARDPRWPEALALAQARWALRIGQRKRRPDGTLEDWVDPETRAKLERRGRLRLAVYDAADAFVARVIVEEEETQQAWDAAAAAFARNDSEDARRWLRQVAAGGSVSRWDRSSPGQSSATTDSPSVENIASPAGASEGKSKLDGHSGVGPETLTEGSNRRPVRSEEEPPGESWMPPDSMEEAREPGSRNATDSGSFEPRDYDWEAVGSLNVGGHIELDVDGPIRADLRTSAFGIDGRQFWVQWYPKAADGSVLPIVTTPGGFAGTEHGGHVTILGPATEYILPPFPSEHGYLVRITMPPDGGKTHGTAAAYLQILEGRRRRQVTGRPLLSADTEDGVDVKVALSELDFDETVSSIDEVAEQIGVMEYLDLNDEQRLGIDLGYRTGPFDTRTAADTANEAVLETSRRFDEEIGAAQTEGRNVAHNDHIDAYRHAYWSFRMTRELGAQQAKEVGDIYEVRYRNEDDGELLMDLYNNRVGRELALDPRNDGRSAAEVVNEAFEKGLLRVTPFKVRSIPSPPRQLAP